MEVLRIGRGPTPMLYFAATTRQTDGAVMVTGSHNPPDYNGFKMMLGGKPFFGAADPARSATWRRPGDVVAEAARQRARRSTSRPTTSTALLSDYDGDAAADGGVGQRQRRGRRRAGDGWSPGCRATHTVLFPDDRRALPQPPPRPDRAGEPGRS